MNHMSHLDQCVFYATVLYSFIPTWRNIYGNEHYLSNIWYLVRNIEHKDGERARS